jgi:hypothetical protein
MLKEGIIREPDSIYAIRALALAPGAVPYLMPNLTTDFSESVLRKRTHQALADLPHHLTTTKLTTILEMAHHQDPRYEAAVGLNGEEPYVKAPDGRSKKLDKLVTIQDRQKDKILNIFVETDMGTAPLHSSSSRRSIKRTIEIFWGFHRGRGPRIHFGLPGARLLFWVHNEKRAEAIRQLIFGAEPAAEQLRLRHNFARKRPVAAVPRDTNVFKVLTASDEFLDRPKRLVRELFTDM